jgi:MOSC domain-containing protein YiiM
MPAHLAAIYISSLASVLPHAVQSVQAIAGVGLEGDRYALGVGTFSDYPGGRQVTLIEEEALEAFTADCGRELTAAQARRNLVTSGVRLNDLVGVTFRIGNVTFRGLGLCEPCTHLAKLTFDQTLPGLVHSGGL